MMRMLPVSKKYILPWDSQISGAGLMAWQQSCVFSSNLIHMIKIHYFCFVEEDLTVSKLYYGREMDSFLMYKRLDNGAFRWPRSADEAMSITKDQYRMLMQGLEIVARYPIEELKETPSIM